MGFLLQLTLSQGHERQEDVDTGALGCHGSWWHNYCWIPSSAAGTARQGSSQGKRENEKGKKKISSWVSWWLGQKLFQEQIRGACHCHCHCHCRHPRAWPLQHSHTLSPGAQSSPQDSSVTEVPHRETFFSLFLFICCSENWDTFQACFAVPTMTNYTLTSGRLHFVQFCFTQTTCLKSCQNASITYHYLPCRKYQGTWRSQHPNIR